MNIEVEIKVKVDDLQLIREKVASFGSLTKAINQIDDYYIPCQRDFFEQKPHPVEWLRIRTNPDKVIFEYDRSINKDQKGEQEYTEEYETEISSPDDFKKTLEFLDFKKVVTVDKHREYWMCGKIEVALDEIKGLGYFVEAEAKGDFKDNMEAKKSCLDFLSVIGITKAEERQIFEGYPVLLLKELSKK